MLKLVLPGEPVAQARPRFYRRGGKNMVYDPQGTVKHDIRNKVLDQIEDLDWQLLRHPRLLFWFQMPIPKHMSKAERKDALTGNLKHIKKPDVDNLVKLYMDVLSGIIYQDDNCVSIGSAIKVYSPFPKTVIYIEETGPLLTLNEIQEGTWTTMID